MPSRDEILAAYQAGPEAIVALVEQLLATKVALEPQVTGLTTHVPVTCAGCGAQLTTAPEVSRDRRQVIDIPEPRPEVTEHQLCRIHGCISTLRKQGYSVRDGLTAVFDGFPLMPRLDG